MAFELIPFPISIIFVLVFGLAVIAVLWKLRRRGKFFLILSNLSVILGVIVFALLFYSITVSILEGPHSPPTLIPHPANITQILSLAF
jgi:hypothetical protein